MPRQNFNDFLNSPGPGRGRGGRGGRGGARGGGGRGGGRGGGPSRGRGGPGGGGVGRGARGGNTGRGGRGGIRGGHFGADYSSMGFDYGALNSSKGYARLAPQTVAPNGPPPVPRVPRVPVAPIAPDTDTDTPRSGARTPATGGLGYHVTRGIKHGLGALRTVPGAGTSGTRTPSRVVDGVIYWGGRGAPLFVKAGELFREGEVDVVKKVGNELRVETYPLNDPSAPQMLHLTDNTEIDITGEETAEQVLDAIKRSHTIQLHAEGDGPTNLQEPQTRIVAPAKEDILGPSTETLSPGATLAVSIESGAGSASFSSEGRVEDLLGLETEAAPQLLEQHVDQAKQMELDEEHIVHDVRSSTVILLEKQAVPSTDVPTELELPTTTSDPQAHAHVDSTREATTANAFQGVTTEDTPQNVLNNLQTPREPEVLPDTESETEGEPIPSDMAQSDEESDEEPEMDESFFFIDTDGAPTGDAPLYHAAVAAPLGIGRPDSTEEEAIVFRPRVIQEPVHAATTTVTTTRPLPSATQGSFELRSVGDPRAKLTRKQRKAAKKEKRSRNKRQRRLGKGGVAPGEARIPRDDSDIEWGSDGPPTFNALADDMIDSDDSDAAEMIRQTVTLQPDGGDGEMVDLGRAMASTDLDDEMQDPDVDDADLERFIGGMARIERDRDVYIEQDEESDRESSGSGGATDSSDDDSEDDNELWDAAMKGKNKDIFVPKAESDSDYEDEEGEEDEDEEDMDDWKYTAPSKGKGKALEQDAQSESDVDDSDEDERFNRLEPDTEEEEEESEDYERFRGENKWREQDETEWFIDSMEAALDGGAMSASRSDRKKVFRAVQNGNFDAYLPTAPAPKGNKAKSQFIPTELQDQWERDRQKKADKKRERELARVAAILNPALKKAQKAAKGKGGKKANRAAATQAAIASVAHLIPGSAAEVADLFDIDSDDGEAGALHGMLLQGKRGRALLLPKTLDAINEMVVDFMADPGRTTLELAPMDKEARKKVHMLAECYDLKSKSKGKGHQRFPILIKLARSGLRDPGRLERLLVASKSSGGQFYKALFTRSGKRDPQAARMAGFARSAGASTRARDGDLVGGGAQRIGEDNVGHRLLSMMGWSEGATIGRKEGGIDAPIIAVVKNTKTGLGA